MKNYFLGLYALLFSLQVFAGEILPADKVVPELVALGIKPKVEKLVDPRLKNLSAPEDQYYLSISLGTLTAEQFKKTHALYGGLSQVPYQQGRAYDLTDFLPPAMQAVANQTFNPTGRSANLEKYASRFQDPTPDQAANMSDEAKQALFNQQIEFHALDYFGISTSSNCWNTVIEILNSVFFDDTKYDLYWLGRWEANDKLRDSRQTELVDSKNIQLFDALLINLEENQDDTVGMLQHAALIINPYLLFEKTDSSENDPYRLSLRADVINKYKKAFAPQRPIIEYRRYGQAPLVDDTPVEFEPEIMKLLKAEIPDLDFKNVCSACETKLGGACELKYTERKSGRITINPATGRGILKAPQKLLKRFSPLRGV